MSGFNYWNGWKIEEELGEGAFGKVYQISKTDSFGNVYKAALKVISIPRESNEYYSLAASGLTDQSIADYYNDVAEEIVREAVLLSDLKGVGNIVGYEDNVYVKNENGIGGTIFIRMELLIPLNQYIQYIKNNELDREDVIKLGTDICKALEACQTINIIHRDIKPENIFVSKFGEFKLGDFGIARTMDGTKSLMSKKGTYTYMAPEVYKGEHYNATVDIYSLGLVLYKYLNKGRIPFIPEGEEITFKTLEFAKDRRLNGEPLPKPCDAMDELGDVILKACAYDPDLRYQSAQEFRQALENVAKKDSLGQGSAAKPSSRGQNQGSNAGAGNGKADGPNNKDNDKGGFGWGFLGWMFPLIGIILFFVYKNDKPNRARAIIKGVAVAAVFIAIINVVRIIGALSNDNDTDTVDTDISVKVDNEDPFKTKEEEYEEEIDQENKELAAGKTEGNTYTQDYFDFKILLDDNWEIASEEEKKKITGEVEGILDDPKETIDSGKPYLDFIATNSVTLQQINVYINDVPLQTAIGYKKDKEETIRSYLDDVKDSVSSMDGVKDFHAEIQYISFLGEITPAAVYTFQKDFSGQDVGVYEKQVVIIKGTYAATITAASYLDDTSQEVLDLCKSN